MAALLGAGQGQPGPAAGLPAPMAPVLMAAATPTATLPIHLLFRLTDWPEPENLLGEDENV